ncbi:MAG: hypothetical protein NTV69_01065 [Caldilinea sp.]|jgi:hypothetical protein|nr:hypothetical protein [Caldilinea sp.]
MQTNLLSRWRARWFGRRPGIRQQPLVGATNVSRQVNRDRQGT